MRPRNPLLRTVLAKPHFMSFLGERDGSRLAIGVDGSVIVANYASAPAHITTNYVPWFVAGCRARRPSVVSAGRAHPLQYEGRTGDRLVS
jgi:hypothetical protein